MAYELEVRFFKEQIMLLIVASHTQGHIWRNNDIAPVPSHKAASSIFLFLS